MQNRQKVIKYWTDAAQNDYRTATILFENARYNHALLFCHLSIEKMLKAVIVQRINAAPPYIHDLVRLSEKAGITMDETSKTLLAEISTFNIAARYDDLKLNFAKKANKKFALKYFIKTKDVLTWLSQKV